jgi:hypothetical protein
MDTREPPPRIGQQRRRAARAADAAEQHHVEIDVVGRLGGRRHPVGRVIEACLGRIAEHHDVAPQFRDEQRDHLVGRQTESRDVLGDDIGAHGQALAVELDVAAVPVKAGARHPEAEPALGRANIERLGGALPLGPQGAGYEQHGPAARIARRHRARRPPAVDSRARRRSPVMSASGSTRTTIPAAGSRRRRRSASSVRRIGVAPVEGATWSRIVRNG